MKQKNISAFLFFISLALFTLLLFIKKDFYSFLENIFKFFGVCETYLGDHSCYNWSWITFDVLLFLFVNLSFLAVFLFFIKQESFIKWYKFAKFAFPAEFFLLLLFIFGYEPSGGAWFPSLGNDLYIFIPIFVFTLVSLIILFKKNTKINKIVEKGYFNLD